MGTSYFFLTLNDETANYLKENGVPLPSPLPASRLPTLGELKAVVRQLEGYEARLSTDRHGIDIEVVDPRGYDAGWSTTLWVKKLGEKPGPLEDGDTVEFNFHKGSPELAVLIVEKLAQICGPLVLIDSAACSPLLVTVGIDPRQAVEDW